MSAQIIHQVILESVTCYKCGVLFAMPDNLMRRFRDKGDDFYCPNGHGQRFTETTAQRLRKEQEARQREREQAAARLQAARDQTEATERSNRALRGANTKLRQRAAAGVCPCCRRSFQNVRRHMEGQHPDFVTQDGAA